MHRLTAPSAGANIMHKKNKIVSGLGHIHVSTYIDCIPPCDETERESFNMSELNPKQYFRVALLALLLHLISGEPSTSVIYNELRGQVSVRI